MFWESMAMKSERTNIWIGIATFCFALLTPLANATEPQAKNDDGPKRAFFAHEKASRNVHQIADWIVDSGDNQSLGFVIVDKSNAKMFVFDAGGRIQGAAPVLLGLAKGDDSAPGIGDRALADIPPRDRTSPAGRFVAEIGHRASGEDIVWLDWDLAFSMHRVLTTNPKEHRLQRLATPTIADNRISWGCINIPVKFYDTVVSPVFTGTKGIVYVLPETRPAREVFASYDVDERARHRTADLGPKHASIAGAMTTQQ